MKARQQNSTAYPIEILMIDSIDHVSGKAGLGSGVTIQLSKNGGAFAAASGAVTEIGNGKYSFAGNATDRNTLGELGIQATATGADMTDDKYAIVPWDPFAVNFGMANVGANVTQWGGDGAGIAVDANHLPKVDVADWNATAVGALPTNFSALGISSGGHIVTVDTLTTLTGYVAPDNADIVTALSDIVAVQASVGSGLKTELDLVKAKTDNLPAVPAAVGSAMTLTSAYDLYHADIQYTRNTATSTDEYTVAFFKNGVLQTSGVTATTITANRRSDGSALFTTATLTQVGTTPYFKYDTTTNLAAIGDPTCLLVNATVNSVAMNFSRIVGRDK